MRTVITFILAILCGTSIALADTYTGTIGDCTYTLDTSDSTLVISGTGAMADYSSASSVPWYDYKSYITTVTIGDSVTSIGSYAFYDCTSLTSITIPDGVTSIGKYAFAHCKKSLTSVTIGSGVTSIGDYAFYDCTSLTSITVSEENTAYVSVDGVLYTYDMTELICYPAQKTDTSYTIPDGVTKIDDYAFEYCTYLTSITIPESTISIGAYAFNGCSALTAIYCLNETPPTISGSTFYHENTSTNIYEQATLYVTSEAYATTEYWKEFTNIVYDISGSSSTDITSVATSISAIRAAGNAIVITSETAQMALIYNLSGQLVTKRAVSAGETSIYMPTGGIYIVALADGTRAKVLVK